MGQMPRHIEVRLVTASGNTPHLMIPACDRLPDELEFQQVPFRLDCDEVNPDGIPVYRFIPVSERSGEDG